MRRLKTALDGACPQRRPGPRRPGDALEVLGPGVLQFEAIAQKPPRTLRDDDGIGRGDALQAGREIWRINFFRRLATVALLRPVKIDSYTCGDKYFAS